MKRLLFVAFLAASLTLVWFGVGRLRSGQDAAANVETEVARRGSLQVSVKAPGVVRSGQSAILTWKTSGIVESVEVEVNDRVSAGQTLASIDRTTLPQGIILAQAELLNARRALDSLLNSRTQSAKAQQTVEEAQQALQNALTPALTQAEAAQKLAEAQKAFDDAQSAYEILTKPASQAAIDQAYANLLLAEKRLKDTDKQIERIQKKLKKDKDKYLFFESRELYQRILEALENKRIQDRRKYEDAREKYNKLLEPVNPTDLAVAEANLGLAKAELERAKVELERVRGGASQAEIAVLEAKLEDAQREWQRWKDGPDEADIAAAEARVAAAEAAVGQAFIQAPFAGTITSVEVKPGDQVAPGTPAFRLDDLNRLFVDARVSEIDINKVRLGQTVLIVLDAAPEREYQGEVVELPLVGEIEDGVVAFNLVIEIKNPDQQIRPGMTASVTIVVDQLEDVLLIPNRAIRIRDGARTVYVLKEGRITPISVILGQSSEDYSVLLEGNIQVGDLIVLTPPSVNALSMTGSE